MDNFEIVKKGYSVEQVNTYIKKLTYEHSKLTDEQLERIISMREQLVKSEGEIEQFKKREHLISSAIVNAIAKAEEIEKVAKQKYDMELQSLKLFHIKWLSYYKQIIAKYPIDTTLSEANVFNENLNKVFENLDTDSLHSSSSASKSNAENGKNINISSNTSTPNASSSFISESSKEEKVKAKQKKSDAEKQFDQESRRISQINANKGVNIDAIARALSGNLDDSDDEENMTAIFGREFQPLKNIKNYYENKEPLPLKEKSQEKAKQQDKPKKERPSEIPPNDSGFSLEEALNPNEDLMTILRSLGLADSE